MFNIIMNFISMVTFAVVVLMSYHLMDIEDEGSKKKTVTYVIMGILCVFVACSLMKSTITELIPNNHYIDPNENKGVEEVIPNSEPEEDEPETEDEWFNTNLPDGMYYLGVQIVDVTPMDNGTYLYSFDVVDDPNWPNNIYLYESEKELNSNVPYMLTMDSLGDDDKLNDQIVVVWACVE